MHKFLSNAVLVLDLRILEIVRQMMIQSSNFVKTCLHLLLLIDVHGCFVSQAHLSEVPACQIEAIQK